jgi:hypothetical protein
MIVKEPSLALIGISSDSGDGDVPPGGDDGWADAGSDVAASGDGDGVPGSRGRLGPGPGAMHEEPMRATAMSPRAEREARPDGRITAALAGITSGSRRSPTGPSRSPTRTS